MPAICFIESRAVVGAIISRRKWRSIVFSLASVQRCCFSAASGKQNSVFWGPRYFSSRPSSTNTDLSDDVGRNEEKGVASMVRERIQQGKLIEDKEQIALAARLDNLCASLCKTDANVIQDSKLSASWFSDTVHKGLLGRIQNFSRKSYLRMQLMPYTSKTPNGFYIHGNVGVGKSYLMDLFFELLQQHPSCTDRRKVRRAHFHEFMLDVHDRIHHFKRQHPKADPLPAVALSLAKEARILCLDEFQVTDIADAMILKRLFSMLWMDATNSSAVFGGRGPSIGMVLVATSNRATENLYEGGINRALFLPFIKTLQRHVDIVEMGGDKDYRREDNSNNGGMPDEEEDQLSYYWPAHENQTRQALDRIFGRSDTPIHVDSTLPVRMSRVVTVPKANDTCAWFDFEDLCAKPLGAADYLAICERYPVLIVDNVPQLNESRFNEARRFITLIDALYESKTRLVLAAHVPLNELLVNFEATVETHDGDEEIAIEGSQNSRRSASDFQEDTFIKGEGGSSSNFSTTLFRTKEGEEVEWSATGRIGVSLAQLSAVRDVSFSFQRAESRLVEMNNVAWGRLK